MPMQSMERRRQIASLTAVTGRVTVAELATRFHVTAETIRRDLTILDQEGGLYRVHGGAVPIQSYRTDHTSYEARYQASRTAKIAIAHKAITLIPESECTIFLDGGTTTALMAEELARISHLPTGFRNGTTIKLITNSLPIALCLADCPQFDIQLLGGTVRPQSKAVVGDIATQTIAGLRADMVFVGTNALTLNHGLSTPDAQEGAVKRAMVTHAKTVIALVDSTKFGLDYLVSFATIDDLTTVVTDKDASPSYVNALLETGINVEYAAAHPGEQPETH